MNVKSQKIKKCQKIKMTFKFAKFFGTIFENDGQIYVDEAMTIHERIYNGEDLFQEEMSLALFFFLKTWYENQRELKMTKGQIMDNIREFERRIIIEQEKNNQ